MFAATCDQMMLHYPPQMPILMANTMENRWKPNVEIAPNCPRCASPNTKFCYYNNYSLSQPRYFCKGCRRYWTKGGSLRNVPVGGGCRKQRRSRPSRSSQAAGGIGSGYAQHQSSSSSDSASESPKKVNIDMAEVFAKFLNPNHEVVGEDSSSGTSSESLDIPPCSFESQWENMVAMDHNGPFSMMEVAQSQDELPPQLFTSEEDEIQEFFVQHPDLLELQEIINEELLQDIPWRYDATTFSNIEWQQDFEPFSCSNDQPKIDVDVVANWSSSPLDIPADGNFF